MEKKEQRVNFLGPMLLIFAGCILLLNVLGIVDWSIWWTILQLWPVFLVAAGPECRDITFLSLVEKSRRRLRRSPIALCSLFRQAEGLR